MMAASYRLLPSTTHSVNNKYNSFTRTRTHKKGCLKPTYLFRAFFWFRLLLPGALHVDLGTLTVNLSLSFAIKRIERSSNVRFRVRPSDLRSRCVSNPRSSEAGSLVFTSGSFELRIKSFTNPIGRLSSGLCCDGSNGDSCVAPCRTKFRVCLKIYQANIDTTSPCTFGDVTTPVLGGNSPDMPNVNVEGFSNPILFPFDTSWPVVRESSDTMDAPHLAWILKARP
ncbi:Neurogenic locus protein delta [Eumeta japonica]|uniref:Neurogenic locus protein delta n=1 Tax=Eumeta variegata TaxID=151549 RepID=A0A4C1XEA0_EUMVA|nr:Neurogenic locus protein delta [Eumeta japonica]